MERLNTEKKMKLPGPIRNIPVTIDLEYTEAPKGEDLIGKLYGASPTKLSTGNESVWYRQGSMSKSPKVNIKLLLRKAKTEEETPARDGLLFSLYNSLLDLEMSPKTVDIRQTGISYSLAV